MTYYMGRHVEREILSALIDGELDAEQRRYVYEHLQECSDCREAHQEFGQIQGIVGELPRLIAPAAFVSDVMEPRRGRDVRWILSGKRRWVAVGSAVVAIGITLAGLVAQPARNEPPVDAYIERHVSVHTGVEPGADVLIAVNGR